MNPAVEWLESREGREEVSLAPPGFFSIKEDCTGVECSCWDFQFGRYLVTIMSVPWTRSDDLEWIWYGVPRGNPTSKDMYQVLMKFRGKTDD